jgi:hypothetical protein
MISVSLWFQVSFTMQLVHNLTPDTYGSLLAKRVRVVASPRAEDTQRASGKVERRT